MFKLTQFKSYLKRCLSPSDGRQFEPPWTHIGGSTATYTKSIPSHSAEPHTEITFQTLRTTETLDQSGQRFIISIKFLIVNPYRTDLVIDDMHVTIYRRSTPSQPGSWLGPSNSVWLMS